jgi:GT2 family glycosyltransferase
MKTAVITTVHGRSTHLRRQIEGLSRSAQRPDQHIVVALGDATVADTVAETGSRSLVMHLDETGPLPVAMGRNTGADVAIASGAQLLVFLDVDCIPAPELLQRYSSAAAMPEYGDALLCGPVTYLPPPGQNGYVLSELREHIDPHPARPAPAGNDLIRSSDYALFWSLSFALNAETWTRIGGFCDSYRGYGGEDTDFGQCAAAAGVPMWWVGGAHAFHQYHPVSDPPVQHLEDIVRNAEIFHQRWGWWPMDGWLAAFEERGLISRSDDGRPYLAGRVSPRWAPGG